MLECCSHPSSRLLLDLIILRFPLVLAGYRIANLAIKALVVVWCRDKVSISFVALEIVILVSRSYHLLMPVATNLHQH